MTAIYNAVKNNQRNQILDLGPCIAANFQFFSQMGCHFHFENFAELLAERDQQNAGGEWHERFLKYLKPEQKFDIVLVWDLFNFVTLAEQQQLFTRLKPYLTPGCLLFTVSYVGALRPAMPAQFKIDDQYFVEVTSATASCKNAAKLTTIEFLKSLPKYQVLRSYLNLEGMQGGISEQVLCYNPPSANQDKSPVTRAFSNAEVARQPQQMQAEFKSPALAHIFECAAAQRGAAILDLGGKSMRNEEHWQTHFDDVFTVDMRQVLQRLANYESTAQANYLRNGSYLGFKREQRFDVIVAWDLLNYLEDEMLCAFGEALTRYAKNSTLLTTLNYNGADIPSQPRAYALTAQGVGLGNNPLETSRTRSQPPLNSLKIQKYLPGFFIKHTYTVQPGMQRGTSEYVLVYKDQSTLAQEKAALYEQVMERRRQRELATPKVGEVIEA